MPAFIPFKSFNKKNFILNFLFGIIFLIASAATIIFFPPGHNFNLYGINIAATSVFYTLLFLTVYFLVNSFLPNKKHGILIALFTVIYLIFRQYNLRNPLFLLLLLALFLTFEFLFSGSRTKSRGVKSLDSGSDNN